MASRRVCRGRAASTQAPVPRRKRGWFGDVVDAERKGYRAVSTSWAPSGAGAARPDTFTEQPIRDYRIAVPGSPYDVRVCVRDDQCEDGDRGGKGCSWCHGSHVAMSGSTRATAIFHTVAVLQNTGVEFVI